MVLQMGAIIRNNLFGYIESHDDVIENKECFCIIIIKQGWYGFYPLGNVINNDDNILVDTQGDGLTFHKINNL
jgi:hypothetical protein